MQKNKPISIDSKYSDDVFTQLVLFLDNPKVLKDIYALREKWFQENDIEDYLFENDEYDTAFFILFAENNYKPKLEVDFKLEELDPRFREWGNRKEYLKEIGHLDYDGIDEEVIEYMDQFLFDIERLLYRYHKSLTFRIPLRQAILTNKVFYGSYEKTSSKFIKRNNNLSTFDFGQMAILFSPEASTKDIIAEFEKSKEELLGKYNELYKHPTYFNRRKTPANIRRDREWYWQHHGEGKSFEDIARAEGGYENGIERDAVRMGINRYKRNIKTSNK